jgi:hypothetical protein
MMNLGPWTVREKLSDTVSIESAPVLRFDGSRCGKHHYRVVRIVDGVRWAGQEHTTLRGARAVASRPSPGGAR